MTIYAVWYYDIIIRGPFAKRTIAKKSLDKVKRDSTCVYEKLRVGPYEPDKDAQRVFGVTPPKGAEAERRCHLNPGERKPFGCKQ